MLRTLSSITFLTLLACCISSLVAHEEGKQPHEHHHKPVKVKPAVVYRPTAVPDRIVLSWTGDPSTSQAVTWRTDTSVTRALVEFAVAADGPGFVRQVKQTVAKTTPFESDLNKAHYHTANMTGLKPAATYVYRVGDGVNWSEWSHFRTASKKREPFSFVYFGDAQNDIKSHWSRVVREAYKDAPRAAFLLHAGDLVNNANNDAQWGEWFYAQGFIPRTMPCLAVPGNHEQGSYTDKTTGKVTKGLTRHWEPTFAFPENGPAGSQESVYWIDYQGMRLIGLNSNTNVEAQAKWLHKVLESNPHPWTVVTFHHPIYSSKAGRDNKALRNLWQPIFDKYEVDLVLNGHDHTYARTTSMKHGPLEAAAETNVATGVRAQPKEGGTVYVVSVSGPKMYPIGRRPFMQRVAEDTQLYQVIEIDGDELRFEARTATGRPYDAFTIKRKDGAPNQLIERIPDTKENVRAKKVDDQ